MASSAGFKLTLALPVLLVAMFGGAHIVFYEYYRTVTFTEVAVDPTRLIGGIESYLSVPEFKELVSRIEDAVIRVEDTQESPADESRPPFVHTFIDVEGVSDLGHTGNLTAHFFNDRLAEVSFHAPDIQAYYAALLQERGIQSDAAREMISGNLRVRLAIGIGGKTFVFTEDMRLTDEMKLWIKRYS